MTPSDAELIDAANIALAGFRVVAERDGDLRLNNSDVSQHATLLGNLVARLSQLALEVETVTWDRRALLLQAKRDTAALATEREAREAAQRDAVGLYALLARAQMAGEFSGEFHREIDRAIAARKGGDK